MGFGCPEPAADPSPFAIGLKMGVWRRWVFWGKVLRVVWRDRLCVCWSVPLSLDVTPLSRWVVLSPAVPFESSSFPPFLRWPFSLFLSFDVSLGCRARSQPSPWCSELGDVLRCLTGLSFSLSLLSLFQATSKLVFSHILTPCQTMTTTKVS